MLRVTLWLLGYPEQALAALHEALALAHELSHPLVWDCALLGGPTSISFAGTCRPCTSRQRPPSRSSTEQGFPLWAALGTSLRGWALAMQGQGEEGHGPDPPGDRRLAGHRGSAVRPILCAPCWRTPLTIWATTEDGLQALAEAHTLVEQQRNAAGKPKSARLRGVMLLRQPGPPQAEAETGCEQALDVARRQEAKSLELRAAMSLSSPVAAAGQARRSAASCWHPIYGWFTEGFDTADLQEAKALLAELS